MKPIIFIMSTEIICFYQMIKILTFTMMYYNVFSFIYSIFLINLQHLSLVKNKKDTHHSLKKHYNRNSIDPNSYKP